MRRFLFWAAAALLAAPSACRSGSQGAAGVTVARPDLGFTATFPRPAEVVHRSEETPVGRFELTTFGLDEGRVSYVIMVASVPPAMQLLAPIEVVTEHIAGQFSALGIPVTSVPPGMLGGVPGYQLRGAGTADGSPVMAEARAAVAAGHLVFATTIAQPGGEEDAARFLDGVRLHGTDQTLHAALWRELAPGEGRFRVEVPGVAESDEQPLTPKGTLFANHVVTHPVARFEVLETTQMEGAIDPVAAARVESFVREGFRAPEWHDVREQPAEANGLRGTEFRGRSAAAGDEHYRVARALRGSRGTYILQVITRTPLDPTVYERFFGSFRAAPTAG